MTTDRSTTNFSKFFEKLLYDLKIFRTIRKKMSTIRINEVVRSDEETGRDGHMLTAEQKLRMYTLKEIVNTEEEYTKLLQFIVDVS